MFKIKILRNIFFASLLISTVIPLYDLFVLHPTYILVMKNEAEGEAARYAEYLVKSFNLRSGVKKGGLPAEFQSRVKLAQNDSLIKLRLFDALGEIVFSTTMSEVGNINTELYFKEIVAAGEIYSKQVKKDGFTAEHESAPRDIVETYVPIMDGSKFHGAIEIYLDVTESSMRLESLTFKSTTLLLGISASLFLVIVLMLYRMRSSIELQAEAEDRLRKLNWQLEERVSGRTADLEAINRRLSAQMEERVQIEQALLDAYGESNTEKMKAQSILESVVDGLLVVDTDLHIGMINGAAIDLLHLQRGNLVGKTLTYLMSDEILVCQLKEAILSLGDELTQFDYHLSDGSGKIYRIRFFQVITTESVSNNFIIHIEDVTGDRLVDKMKKEFLAMAAHELRTPLSVILGYSELLQGPSGQFTPKERNEFAGLITEKAALLSRIVDDLLDISRVEGGQRLVLNCSQFNYCAFMDKLLTQYGDLYREINFQFVCDESDILVNADSMRINQVVENIVINAVKYSSREQITINCSVVGDYCETVIEDKGLGMTNEEVGRVFEKFYRVNSEDYSVGGTGLGLSIAKHIVEAHGGRIWIRSVKGVGTKVGFTLPIDQ